MKWIIENELYANALSYDNYTGFTKIFIYHVCPDKYKPNTLPWFQNTWANELKTLRKNKDLAKCGKCFKDYSKILDFIELSIKIGRVNKL